MTEPTWTSIAKLTSVAEAAYFADWLEAQQIEARVEPEHHYSAVAGHWATSYLLQVPTGRAELARERIRAELAEEGQPVTGPEPHSAPPLDRARHPWSTPPPNPSRQLEEEEEQADLPRRLQGMSDGMSLAMIGLLAAVVLVALLLTALRPPQPDAGRLAQPSEVQPPGQFARLLDLLKQSGQHWQTPPDQLPRQRLSYEPKFHRFHLQIDADGDGHFERQLHFTE